MEQGSAITQIWIDQIDDETVEAINRALGAVYFGYDIHYVIEQVAHLKMQLWRGRGFIVLTTINTHPGGKELNIWTVGGKGYIKEIPRIYETLKDFALKEDCKWITGFVDRKGFGRLYKEFNTKKYGLWIKEINNV